MNAGRKLHGTSELAVPMVPVGCAHGAMGQYGQLATLCPIFSNKGMALAVHGLPHGSIPCPAGLDHPSIGADLYYYRPADLGHPSTLA